MKYILIAAVVLIAGFIIALQFIPIGIEPLTEVYFENHTNLPRNVFLNKTYNFEFTVHNLEYMDMPYTFIVSREYNNKTEILDRADFFLKNNETMSFYESFSFKEKFERAKINVEVVKNAENPQQHDPNLKNITIDLHFWVEEIKGTQIIIVPD